jgi:hypothetical protein
MSEGAMDQAGITRRDLLIGTAVAVAAIPFQGAYATPISKPLQTKESSMTTQENTVPFTKTAPPEWLLAFWKEIDDKTFGKGFDCLRRMQFAISVLPIGMDAKRSART